MKEWKLLKKYDTPMLTIEPGEYDEQTLELHLGKNFPFTEYPEWFKKNPAPSVTVIARGENGNAHGTIEYFYQITSNYPLRSDRLSNLIYYALRENQL